MSPQAQAEDVCTCELDSSNAPVGMPCPSCRQQMFDEQVFKADLADEVRVYRATRDEELPVPIYACDLEIETLTWIIQDYIPEGSVGLLAAPRGISKSFVALDWTCSVATGYSWLGSFRAARHTAMYIAAEGSGGQGRRVRAWETYHKRDVGKNMIVLPGPIQLANPAHVAYLTRQLREHDVRFLVIDTLSRSTLGLDQNTDGAIVINALYQIRDARQDEGIMITVVVVHHTGKDTSRGARGDSRYEADVDFVYTLEADDEGRMTLQATKDPKDAAAPEPIGLKRTVVDFPASKSSHGDVSMFADSCVIERGELAVISRRGNGNNSDDGKNDKQIIDHIRDNPKMNTTAIAKALKRQRTNISARLGYLQTVGVVRDEDTRKNASAWVIA